MAWLNSFKQTDEGEERQLPAGLATNPGGRRPGDGTTNAVMAPLTILLGTCFILLLYHMAQSFRPPL